MFYGLVSVLGYNYKKEIMNNKIKEAISEINTIIKGKDEVIQKILCAILANGHILLEDIPGVGKTTLSTSIAKSLSLDYKRVQFTPDVLPSDIVGFSMLNNATHEFEFKPGPVFCNLFLADELNRTSPKTQSALLEVMEEGQVTIDGITHKINDNFVVIATQNPTGSAGTNLLPESQLDRFLISTTMGYPSHSASIDILKTHGTNNKIVPSSVITTEELSTMKDEADKIFVHDSIYDYITSLCEFTRSDSMFSHGVSPRGAIALLKMSKASAYVSGHDFVRAEDIQNVLPEVFGHRIKISSKAKSEGMNTTDTINYLLKQVTPPRQ